MRKASVMVGLVGLLSGCPSPEGEPVPDGGAPDSGAPDAGPPQCTVGALRCAGDLIETCTAQDGGSAFSAPAACEAEGVCRDDVCRAPTATMLAQAGELAAMMDYLKAQTAYHRPLAWDELKRAGRREIIAGDGTTLAYFGALYHAFIAVPQGHQGLLLTSRCGSFVPYPGYAQRGVCGRPHARGIVVTSAAPGNLLGLSAGDLLLSVGAAQGAAVLPELANRPACATSWPSTSFRDAVTASSFVDSLYAGDVLAIETADGGTRQLTFPDAGLTGDLAHAVPCAEPLGRPSTVAASYLRPDGVGVIRLPSFVDYEQQFPTNPTQQQFDAYKAAFEAKIKAAFDQVKTAPAVIWDLRGNGGGLTQVGLDILSGFPLADAATLSYCQQRIPDSDPADVYAQRYATYALSPGGAFAYSGKVAVLTDGLNYSAADYFSRAAKLRTGAVLVGAPTAGAFGATSDNREFTGPPAFRVYIDVNRCFDASTGQPIEGESTVPTLAVDYDPKDLAAGRDTVLEAAAQKLLQ